ncbi:MAG: hypothetical protein Q7R73_01075 [bacterium]|nr:hypothetical protein [bacterium]
MHRHKLGLVNLTADGVLKANRCVLPDCHTGGEPILMAGGDIAPSGLGPAEGVRSDLPVEARLALLEMHVQALQEQIKIVLESFGNAFKAL